MTAALILIGAPGAGKTSVMEKLGTLLQIEAVEHGAFESEALSQGWPALPFERWLPQLQAVIDLQVQAGRRLLLLTATTETQGQLEAVGRAFGGPSLTVCLTVMPETAVSRIDAREPDSWPGKQQLMDHARRLAAEIPSFAGIDARISTEARDPQRVALEILALPAVAALRGHG